jgi:hypothetical protein
MLLKERVKKYFSRLQQGKVFKYVFNCFRPMVDEEISILSSQEQHTRKMCTKLILTMCCATQK